MKSNLIACVTCLERRDAQLECKMAEVLMVYRDVSLYRAQSVHDARAIPIYTVSVDEKPGVQALGTTAPDLLPVPGKHSSIGRDHEYVRHGTLSIPARVKLLVVSFMQSTAEYRYQPNAP